MKVTTPSSVCSLLVSWRPTRKKMKLCIVPRTREFLATGRISLICRRNSNVFPKSVLFKEVHSQYMLAFPLLNAIKIFLWSQKQQKSTNIACRLQTHLFCVNVTGSRDTGLPVQRKSTRKRRETGRTAQLQTKHVKHERALQGRVRRHQKPLSKS